MDQLHLINSPSEQDISQLGSLIEDSRLYKSGQEYQNLLDFIVRLKSFAPFNAMLLQIQKPGLRFAATAKDWRERFKRTVKEESRPLLILWPFGPVALVYDILDTEGSELPDNVLNAFLAHGDVTTGSIDKISDNLTKKHIQLYMVDVGDTSAGSIQRVSDPDSNDVINYKVRVNKNHTPALQLVTIAHELGHLFMGHLGGNKKLKITARQGLEHSQQEVEAESIAYLTAKRLGVESISAHYLSNHVESEDSVSKLDIYRIVWSAGKVEELLDVDKKKSS